MSVPSSPSRLAAAIFSRSSSAMESAGGLGAAAVSSGLDCAVPLAAAGAEGGFEVGDAEDLLPLPDKAGLESLAGRLWAHLPQTWVGGPRVNR